MMVTPQMVASSARREGYFLRRAAVVALMLLVASIVAPMIESRLFPVASGIHLHLVLEGERGGILFRFKGVRHRQCTRLWADWYEYDDGALVHAPVVTALTVPPANRPPGPSLSAWYTTDHPATYVLRAGYDCGLPWQSILQTPPLDVRL